MPTANSPRPVHSGPCASGSFSRRGAAFVLAASDEGSGFPEPERTVIPSVPDISIGEAVFRIAPGGGRTRRERVAVAYYLHLIR